MVYCAHLTSASARRWRHLSKVWIFVDIAPHTLNIDPALVAQAVDDLARGGEAAKRWLPPAIRNSQFAIRDLKAVLPVDAFGQPADYDPIQEVTERHGLAVIEDSCRDDWDALFRSLRNQGRDVFDAWLNHTRLGYNYRMDEMSAALGFSQLKRIEELLSKRERVAGWYNERLADVEGVQTPYIAPTTTRTSWFVYVVRTAPEIGRDQVMRELKEQGIPSRPYFTPIHLQPFYVQKFGYRRGDFPVTEEAGDTCLALPFSSVMVEEQAKCVCRVMRITISRQG